MSPRFPPILRTKNHRAPSVFRPENLLREGRRQKGVSEGRIPELCVLDPDGDIVRRLLRTGRARKSASWSCYHSELYEFVSGERRIGIVGCAVGAPYAVLVAEQMFASGCRLLLSITSSGQEAPIASPPYFVLVERALRDEGTSYHYRPPTDFAEADARLIETVFPALEAAEPAVLRGATWTIDAPFRETEAVIDHGRDLGLAAIEMVCAALYALVEARNYPIVCLAHVTNTMAVSEGDFEKGDAGGVDDALELIDAIAGCDVAGICDHPCI